MAVDGMVRLYRDIPLQKLAKDHDSFAHKLTEFVSGYDVKMLFGVHQVDEQIDTALVQAHSRPPIPLPYGSIFAADRQRGDGTTIEMQCYEGKEAEVQHVRRTIEELRRYIATCEARNELEEVDTLLAVALEEVRRRLRQKENENQSRGARSD